MDRLGEAAEKAAGQVRAGAHRLLWSGVLYTQRRPTATGDHKVMLHLRCEYVRPGRRGVMLCPILDKTQPWNDGISLLLLLIFSQTRLRAKRREVACVIIGVSSRTDFELSSVIRRVLLLRSQVICSVCRYQYYLQLKKDVLEGRITCSLEQAIHLASLAVQGNNNMLLFFFICNATEAEHDCRCFPDT